MKILIDVSTDTEATSSPWWLIIDPRQNFETSNQGAHNISAMITGPFFSREEAEKVLKHRRHHYSKNAVVYCASGCYTEQYDKAYREAWKEQKLIRHINDGEETLCDTCANWRGEKATTTVLSCAYWKPRYPTKPMRGETK
jgi:hypothetical protein